MKEKFNRFRAWGGGWFLAGVVILGIGIAIDVRVQSSFPEWSMVLVAFVPMSLLAVGIDKASKEWDAGREERRKKRSVERTVAVVGYYVWLIPSVLMVVGLIGVTLAGTSRISGVLALFGGIWLFIAGVMGGKPSMKKGLEPLLLNKRIMNWQLAVSAAIASPLLGAAISNQKDLLSSAGTNWGYPAIFALIWIVAAGLGTLLCEPLKYRLEAEKGQPVAAARPGRSPRRLVGAPSIGYRRLSVRSVPRS